MNNIQRIHTDCLVLDELLAVNLDTTIWTGRKKLTPEDLGAPDLPPEELASLGSKRIANPESLRIFSALKARAAALLERTGIRFMSGYAIPATKAGEIIDELVKIRTEFTTAKEKFLAEYDTAVDAWVAKHSEWGNIIKNSVVSSDHVRQRLHFGWQVFRVYPASEDQDGNVALQSGLAEKVSGLGATLFSEVAAAADEMLREVYEGRDLVTHRALSPLRTLREKLVGLTFISPEVAPVVSVIDTAISRIPKQGNITGADLLMLKGLVELLKNTDSLVDEAQRVINGTEPSLVLDALVKQDSTVPTATAEPITTTTTMIMPSGVVPPASSEPQFVPSMPVHAAPRIANVGLW